MSPRTRRLRYSVAISLDGYIADPDGGFDWIPADPEIDFAAFLSGIDTVVMGRKTFEVTLTQGTEGVAGKNNFVFSRTLNPAEFPNVTVISDDPCATVARLKEQDGKDIWLFGGAEMFATLARGNLVDTVEVGIVPTILGSGIPLISPPVDPLRLELESSETFPGGILLIKYNVRKNS
jgi:dihydrofolate reductase